MKLCFSISFQNFDHLIPWVKSSLFQQLYTFFSFSSLFRRRYRWRINGANLRFPPIEYMEKVKKKNNSSTSVDRESRRHTDRNHAVASGFVYNRWTLASTHAPYFKVGVYLAPYLRDTLLMTMNFLHCKTFNFVWDIFGINECKLRIKIRNNNEIRG